MARVQLVMPKMGESIMEATILKWRKQPGESVALDEPVLDIATDKVDSEVPSPVAGVLVEILFKENEVVPINTPIAVLETDQGASPNAPPAVGESSLTVTVTSASAGTDVPYVPQSVSKKGESGRFYSPLVRTIAREERIGMAELEQISGTGSDGRVTKKDMMEYLAKRTQPTLGSGPVQPPTAPVSAPAIQAPSAVPAASSLSGNVEIIEMDRMRKIIAENMVASKRISPHVTSFVEVDVTNIVAWRNRVKDAFKKQYSQNITFTPIFVEAIVRAIRDYPMINISVDDTRIIVKKDINIGMAAALPSGNLIVPVIKNADHLNLVGLTKTVNDLAGRARTNALKPDEIQGGTFTLTNVGTFGNVMGTPIIPQPQVAIMATGAIRKKPAVLETKDGDVIAIRHMMFLSMSYDHRVVDGMLGGSFIRRVADYLEQFDSSRAI